MKKFGIVIVTLAAATGIAILAALLGVLSGAFVGWVVGWFFADTILGFFAALGITSFKMWQVGAVLGFVGSFFKSSVTTAK